MSIDNKEKVIIELSDEINKLKIYIEELDEKLMNEHNRNNNLNEMNQKLINELEKRIEKKSKKNIFDNNINNIDRDGVKGIKNNIDSLINSYEKWMYIE